MRFRLICLLPLLLTGCTFLTPQPDLSRFFVLTPSTSPSAVAEHDPPRIGLGPIEFPAYLQRPQMVTRAGANEIELSEVYRWGEALDANFTRVLAQNLGEITGSDQIVMFPWYSTQELDFAVRVNVTQFDVDHQGTARLLARWRIVDPTSDKLLRTGLANLQVQATDNSPDAAVAALSSLVHKLAQEIAVGLSQSASLRNP